MAFKTSIPFHAFKLKFATGNTIHIPLKDSETIRINDQLHVLAGKYVELLQKKIFDKGQFTALLNERHIGTYYKDVIAVEFNASKDGMSYPEMIIDFEYYFNDSEQGYRAYIPALGVECYTLEASELEGTVKEAIYLDFMRKQRFRVVQNILSAMWLEALELLQESVDISFPSLAELDAIEDKNKKQILPEVARLVKNTKQVVYGRKEELANLATAMTGRFSKNVLLVGPSGVGKTALVWELVRQRKKRKIKGEVWETTASMLIKELTRNTGWQDNIVFLCKELSKRGDFLFIRNLRALFEVGQYEGNSISIAEYMGSYISRGEVQMISECTEEELGRIELKSPNFLSNFQIIRLKEPEEDLENIILSKVQAIAKIQKITIELEAIKETIRLNRRFTPYAGFPGKPIRFLESILINTAGTQAVDVPISRSDIVNYFCEETGMPNFIVDPSIPMDLMKIKATFKEDIYGQDLAINSVVDMLGAVKTALTRTQKPIASFLFVGPTGVGKTELAKVLTKFMFGSRNKLIRFDMSEYSTSYAVMRLIGTDYFSDGRLTSAIRREPFCVLLFDEIEKAHPSFYDLLLQILSEGRLTDSQGKLVNFCSTIIILTSNIGAANLQTNRVGWSNKINKQEVDDHFINAVQKHFRPELYNRIEQVIAFEPLSLEVIRSVVDREIALLRKREGIRFRKMDLNIHDSALNHLGKIGFESKYGARYLQRAIREQLIVPLAKKLNIEDVDDQLIVNISAENNQIIINTEADPMGLDLLLEELDKINQADFASDLRRSIERFKEGHFYVSLLSDLLILEQEKKKRGSRFWNKTNKVKAYTQILKTQEEVEELCKTIEAYEMDLSLSCLALQNYNTALPKALEAWENNYKALKVAFYTRRHSENNTAYITLIGSNLRVISDFYLNIIEQKGYKIKEGATHWYNEAFYNKMVSVRVPKSLEEPDVFINELQNQADYIRYEWDNDRKANFKARDPKDELYAISWTIKGDGAYLYFSEEGGMQHWNLNPEQNYKFLINIDNNVEARLLTSILPKGIHRQVFYDNKPIRRKIEVDRITDNIYKIDRFLTLKKQAEALQEVLEMRFRIKIDNALV